MTVIGVYSGRGSDGPDGLRGDVDDADEGEGDTTLEVDAVG